MRKIDRVLQDVDLFLERRRDIDRRVGHDQRIGMRGTSMTKQWLMRRPVRNPAS